MPKFIFDAPAHHVLEGKEIDPSPVHGGESFTVSDSYAEYLLANPGAIPIKDLPAELSKLTRPALDEIARERGFDPSEFPNKESLVEALDSQQPSDHVPSGGPEPVNTTPEPESDEDAGDEG